VEELARVDDGLHHHVVPPGCLGGIDDRLDLLERGRHRDGAGHVLARLQRGDRLSRMVRDRRVDVHGVDVRIAKHVCHVGVAPRDPELVGCLRQRCRRPLADRQHLGVRVRLIDGNELGAEAESDDPYPDLLCHR
jgi:hypothetical protein